MVIDLVAALEDEQPALARALDMVSSKELSSDFEYRWPEVELHGEASKRLVHLRMQARDACSGERLQALLSFGLAGRQQ